MTDEVKAAIERVWLDTQKYLDRRDTVETTVDIIDILTDHARLSAEVERLGKSLTQLDAIYTDMRSYVMSCDTSSTTSAQIRDGLYKIIREGENND